MRGLREVKDLRPGYAWGLLDRPAKGRDLGEAVPCETVKFFAEGLQESWTKCWTKEATTVEDFHVEVTEELKKYSNVTDER